MKNRKKLTRVGIWGAAGLLGSRLVREIKKNPDMEVTVKIVKNDPTLKKIWVAEEISKKSKSPAQKFYLDEPHRIVREMNKRQKNIEFIPADQLNLKKECDIVIDTTTSLNNHKFWKKRYHHFPGQIILQSGEYPYGELIVPPLRTIISSNSNLYRQGDCLLSGLVPILAPFQEIAKKIRINILMQYGEKLNDYPTNQRINATYLRNDLIKQLEEEINSLFDQQKIIIESLLQVPGLDYYTATIQMETKKPLSSQKLKKMLENQPRLLLAPTLINSTYEIDHFLKEKTSNQSIPPITIYGSSLSPSKGKTKKIRIQASFYSRLIAILPNIDAIRILAQRKDPLTAMKMTNHYAGFKT